MEPYSHQRKLIDQIIYFGGNISSTESDVHIHIGKASTAIDGLLISDVLLWTPTHGHASIGRPVKHTFISCVWILEVLEDIPNAIVNRDGWQERVTKYVLSSRLDDDGDDDDHHHEALFSLSKVRKTFHHYWHVTLPLLFIFFRQTFHGILTT